VKLSPQTKDEGLFSPKSPPNKLPKPDPPGPDGERGVAAGERGGAAGDRGVEAGLRVGDRGVEAGLRVRSGERGVDAGVWEGACCTEAGPGPNGSIASTPERVFALPWRELETEAVLEPECELHLELEEPARETPNDEKCERLPSRCGMLSRGVGADAAGATVDATLGRAACGVLKRPREKGKGRLGDLLTGALLGPGGRSHLGVARLSSPVLGLTRLGDLLTEVLFWFGSGGRSHVGVVRLSSPVLTSSGRGGEP